MKALLSYLLNRHFTQGAVAQAPQPFDPTNIFGGPGLHFKDFGPTDSPIPGDPMMNMFNQVGQAATGQGQPLAPGPMPPAPGPGRYV